MVLTNYFKKINNHRKVDELSRKDQPITISKEHTISKKKKKKAKPSEYSGKALEKKIKTRVILKTNKRITDFYHNPPNALLCPETIEEIDVDENENDPLLINEDEIELEYHIC